MGYPMTFKRVVARNGLADGDYTTAPLRLQAGVNLSFTDGSTLSEDETKRILAPHLRDRLAEFERLMKLLAGDLRRLERDAVDEHGICGPIAQRTGFDEDMVAAVLKEFMEL